MFLRELKADRRIGSDGKLIFYVSGNDVGFAYPTLTYFWISRTHDDYLDVFLLALLLLKLLLVHLAIYDDSISKKIKVQAYYWAIRAGIKNRGWMVVDHFIPRAGLWIFRWGVSIRHSWTPFASWAAARSCLHAGFGSKTSGCHSSPRLDKCYRCFSNFPEGIV